MTITEQQPVTMGSLIAEALEAQAERERYNDEVFEKVRAETVTKARAAITDELRRIMGQAYDLLQPELLGHISAPCARFSYRGQYFMLMTIKKQYHLRHWYCGELRTLETFEAITASSPERFLIALGRAVQE